MPYGKFLKSARDSIFEEEAKQKSKYPAPNTYKPNDILTHPTSTVPKFGSADLPGFIDHAQWQSQFNSPEAGDYNPKWTLLEN